MNTQRQDLATLEQRDSIVARLSQAREIIATAKPQALKQLVDVSYAAAIFAKRQKLGEEVIDYARSINMDALCRLGEVLRDGPKANGGDAQRTRFQTGTESPPTLAELGIDKKTSAKAQKLAELPDELRLAVREKGMTIAKAIKAHRAKERKEDLEAARASISEQAKADIEAICDLRVCSCADLFRSGVKPDAVITDPPYPAEFLHTFTELAIGCKSAQVPLVAVMSGQSYMPDVMRRLCEHLSYRWMLAYLTPGGQAVQQWAAKANAAWKPVLLFGEAIEWFGDVATSKPNDNDKRFHGWGQSESGMADLVNRLTKPGQLVCDPFLGGGTTAVVSLALGRRFVGCDIDAAHVEQAKRRIANEAISG